MISAALPRRTSLRSAAGRRAVGSHASIWSEAPGTRRGHRPPSRRRTAPVGDNKADVKSTRAGDAEGALAGSEPLAEGPRRASPLQHVHAFREIVPLLLVCGGS
jgi:hypothetical protein